MRKGNTHKEFTKDEAEKILALWEEGRSAREIGEVLGRTRDSIHTFICVERKDGTYSKKFGIKTNEEGAKPTGANEASAPAKSEKETLMVGGKKVAEVSASLMEKPAEKVTTTRDLTPREMIKKLYDMGYRIENNHLVYIQKVMVKMSDILNC